ncbi:SDR family NAD(P)-dependent oxidoreductase [Daejeonella oryzae]|uniref:SDR family NAD(P)-dependent oxidoreductase n=1 Tax=Daejeonella oryzae TaxID=1122943 RepID=UPI00040B083A|nr:SDR family oxidoreductase [Daejeonella oryzae]
MKFEGKTYLIIGGSSGIGFSIAEKLIEGGAEVFSTSRDISKTFPGEKIQLDISDDLSDLNSQLPEKLDGVVYCPGTINLKPFSRLTDQDFINDFSVNVLGAVKVIRQVINKLKKSGNASIILYSTVAAKTGMNFHSSVSASKSAVEGLAISLSAEFAFSGIRVNTIAPSLTDTPLASALLSSPEKREVSAKRHPLGRIGNAEDISSASLFLLSDESTWITGQVLHVDGGLSSLRV